MKIQELEIEGFRSLKKVVWRPGNLNVIIGRNGSGKSNLLQFLELLSISAKGSLAEYILSSGGMNTILWDGRTDRIRFRLETSPLFKYRNDNLIYEATLAQVGNSSAYVVEKEQLANYTPMREKNLDTPFKLLERSPNYGRLFDEDARSFLSADPEKILENETLLSITATPFLDKKYQQASFYREQMEGWFIYQDMRTDRKANIRREAEARNVKQVASDGQNLVNVLHTLYQSADDPDFKESIDDGMRAAFGNLYKELTFSPQAEGRIQLGVRWNSLRRVNPANALSDGTLRFLFLLTVLANPNPASLIAIDEPEANLHPSMLPIVAEYAVDAATRTQVVFTTHSPQFLNAFSKDDLPTTTVAMWDGETFLQNLQGEQLETWLQEYTLGNLFGSGELENFAQEYRQKGVTL